MWTAKADWPGGLGGILGQRGGLGDILVRESGLKDILGRRGGLVGILGKVGKEGRAWRSRRSEVGQENLEES